MHAPYLDGRARNMDTLISYYDCSQPLFGKATSSKNVSSSKIKECRLMGGRSTGLTEVEWPEGLGDHRVVDG